MNDNKKNKDRYEKEGVIYTPSIPKNDDTIDYTVKKKPTKKVQIKSQYKTLMLITVISGIVICMVVFAVVYNSFTDHGDKSVKEPDSTPLAEVVPPIEEKNEASCIGVLRGVDAQAKQIDVLDITNQKEYRLVITNATDLKNKYGQSVVLSEFKVGDIVTISFNNSDKEIKALTENAEGFEYQSITKLSVDPTQKVVKHNNDTYTYNDGIVVTYKNKPYDLTQITDIDVVTIKGYKDTIWSIDVEQSHGYIKVINQDKVTNGTLEIGKATFMQLADADELTVLEGVQKVVIDGDNIEPYVKEVVVSSLETSILDVTLVQAKSSVVVWKVSEPDYELKINGVVELSREPMILEYGVYDVAVSKDGFVDFAEKININSPQLEIPIELKKVVNMGKLAITSEPTAADLYVDNAYIGVTPVTKDVVQGDHVIVLKKSGYKDFTLGVVVSETSPPYNITLQTKDDVPFNAAPNTNNQNTNNQNTTQNADQNTGGVPTIKPVVVPTIAPIDASASYVPFEKLPASPTDAPDMQVPFQVPQN